MRSQRKKRLNSSENNRLTCGVQGAVQILVRALDLTADRITRPWALPAQAVGVDQGRNAQAKTLALQRWRRHGRARFSLVGGTIEYLPHTRHQRRRAERLLQVAD